MSDDSQRPIIVKKIRKGGHGHHGGAWKIAYADFVTAMMAFFLLMWLLGSTSKGDLQGIAEYFKNPLKVSLSGGSGAGDAKSVIKGGGSDLTRATGQMNELVPGQKKRGATDLEEVKGALHAIDVELLQSLKDKLDRAIDESETLRQFRNQLLVDITTEGLRVQIVDARNRPMFAMGSSALQPYTRDILREVGKVLNAVPNGISLSGHTDAAPYSGGERGYSNWELSADRSNAARRELLAGGMAEERIARVIGLGSAVLLDSNDPLNPINRRVSIIVMNREAEEAARRDGGILRADSAVAVKEGIGVQPR
ncbi:MAG: flagellar motor protein MotB [Betaproteobacteria bacterium]|jgi:chemotaxis protein MotB|nr:flagellar motor protein MotB [Rhodocyclaceae bacterium]MCA3134970.1 flagellar motor protein MotB [Rhodocyclaceae bacterium]MCA3143767.1 flagellar motor protein MotB [Rhodocyclaceae bacterium]MCA3147080.1 flagellar motor protein MotB [Rhodocyclaceae bacterium]MCE2898045.1 flagellar motor protein MotB [Betaproteobacteria bacterium]